MLCMICLLRNNHLCIFCNIVGYINNNIDNQLGILFACFCRMLCQARILCTGHKNHNFGSLMYNFCISLLQYEDMYKFHMINIFMDYLVNNANIYIHIIYIYLILIHIFIYMNNILCYYYYYYHFTFIL
jgi:hypothetical protein